MSKINITDITPGKKYKMIIQVETDLGVINSIPSIPFTAPEATTSPKNAGKLSIQKLTNPVRLLIAIPEDIMANLVWKDDVKDVAHIVYRTAPTRADAMDNQRYYIISTTTPLSVSSPIVMTGNNSASKTDFTNSTWVNGHPRVFSIKPTTTNFYSFQFAVARYTKNADGSWTGRWLTPANKVNKLLSQQSGWGS